MQPPSLPVRWQAGLQLDTRCTGGHIIVGQHADGWADRGGQQAAALAVVDACHKAEG
jgi:hypothetical protein